MRRPIAFGAPAVVCALLAKALVVAPAIGAAAAADGAFKNDAIAFFYMVNRRGIFAELLDAPENLMPENNRIIDFKLAMEVLDVGAADAAHLDFDQAAVRRNIRNRIFADFEFIRTQ